MLFYHYTTFDAVIGIKNAALLRTSPAGWASFKPWLSLTTDEDSSGHGLPDGRPITAEQAQHVSFQLINGKMHCYDHTECRVLIDLDENDSELIRASAILEVKELAGLNIAAYLPVDRNPGEKLVKETSLLILAGILTVKSPTWWYYWNAVPLSKILRFEQRNTQGLYVAMP